MKVILGKKMHMTQKFLADGTVIPVTAVKVGPCVVTQVKTVENDGYAAIQIGFGITKKLAKPQAGHLKELPAVAVMQEFPIDGNTEVKRGDQVTVADFAQGDVVEVTGVSKGKGFQGVVKRHGFHGQKASHGHKDQERMSGSIGAGGVQRVFKGLRMGGHMGDEQVTVKNLEVIAIDLPAHILFIKGAVPGAMNSLVSIRALKAIA